MSEGGFWTGRRSRALVGGIVTLGLILLLVRVVSSFYIEVLWFAEVGQSASFWKRTIWAWGMKGGVVLIAAALAWLNLRVVAQTLGAVRIRRRFGNIEIAEQLPRSYLFWGVLGTSALFGIWFGAALPQSTSIQALLMLNAPEWGQIEPVFNRDAGFYVFTLPLILQALSLGLALTFLLLAICVAGYSATGAIRLNQRRPTVTQTAVRHLGTLAASFLVLLAVRFWVGRYLLLVDGNSGVAGIFGFADSNARVPALQGLSGITLIAAFAVAYGAFKERLRLVVFGAAGVVLAWLVAGQMYPSLVQRFRVEPNELARETRFIEYNIQATREGFGLTALQERAVRFDPPSEEAWGQVLGQFRGLPVWRPSALLTTYRELEARFRYYDFPTVSIGRYQVGDETIPVALAVREVEPRGIEDPNWQNLHLRERYVAGLGAVASVASLSTPEGRPAMLLSDLPRSLVPGGTPDALRLERTGVYFGTRAQQYAILSPTDSTFLAPDRSPGVAGVDYPAGIQVGSFLRRLALAWRFRDADLLFTSEVDAESRFVFRRQVAQRITAIAPFLRLQALPYAVAYEGRLVWIADAYTSSGSFPLARHRPLGRSAVNYLRNSVKVVVDATSGSVQLYVIDGQDPIAAGLSRAFPGLMLPIDEMPEGLRAHLRYPKELLELQSQVLFEYHQETAPVFHGQRDVWTRPEQFTENPGSVPYEPEYAHYTLPGETDPEFLLTTVFVPSGRQNLTAMLVARSDPGLYGELILLDVPVEDQIPGPRQVEALIEQDPTISGQFSLWRQGGSKVWLGHLHLIPVDGSLFYMEPIFLAAEEDAIPELTRFVVSDGRRVAMTETLAAGVLALSGLDDFAESAPDGIVAAGVAVGSNPSAEAVALLDQAEAALRAGDYAGFGEALAQLRSLLEQGADEATPPPAPRD